MKVPESVQLKKELTGKIQKLSKRITKLRKAVDQELKRELIAERDILSEQLKQARLMPTAVQRREQLKLEMQELRKQMSEYPEINQSTLANDLNLTRVSIGKLYHNTATQFDSLTLTKLCRYFKCEVGDLLYFKDGL